MTARHLFICTNDRSAGKPACGPRGGHALVAAVQRELIARATTDPRAIEALVTPCGCLGPCFDGPNAVVYADVADGQPGPGGTWYAALEAGDASALVDHLVHGVPLAARLSRRPGPDDGGP